MKKAPKQIVKDQFGSREALVEKIAAQMGDEATDDARARLRGAKNAQLLRLNATLAEVQSKFGSKQALVDAITAKKFEGRKTDPKYAEKIAGYTQPRLLDLYRQVG